MGSTIQVSKRERESITPGKSSVQATEEQIVYAKILDIGMKIGLVGIIISFLVYITGLVTPKIPVNDVSSYWGMKSHDYLVSANIKGGWSWFSMYNYGDFLNFFPIALLSGVTIFCYIAIIPTLLRKKDTVYAIIALLEVIVLAGAASGIFAGGGH